MRSLALLLFVALESTRAMAYGDYSSYTQNSDVHLLSVGAGIASPAGSSAYAENPAGLAYLEGIQILAAGSSDNSNLNPIGLTGLGLFGNGMVGATIGAETSTASGSLTLLEYGLAANIPTADVSIGLAGTYVISDGNFPATDTWGLNAGAIFNAHGAFRVGATVYNLTNGIGGFGAGMAYDFNPYGTLVVDGASDKDVNGKTLKPGLQVRLDPVDFSFSYGFDLDDDGASPITRGTTIGFGAKLSEAVRLLFYYNQFDKYYLGLTFRL